MEEEALTQVTYLTKEVCEIKERPCKTGLLRRLCTASSWGGGEAVKVLYCTGGHRNVDCARHRVLFAHPSDRRHDVGEVPLDQGARSRRSPAESASLRRVRARAHKSEDALVIFW
jgi:hypothetical protein